VLNDFYFKEAKRCNYVSRAAFKLLHINDKCAVIKPKSLVLDLGCHPGAWLQVACQQLGPHEKGGAVIGIDLKGTPVPSAHCDDRVQVR
jgi:23S rRNA (uridine2552-2'-O)-methyltransferase